MIALPNFRLFPGWEGLHVRDEAPGALRNGSRVRKVRSEPRDTHQDGALATVLGSIEAPGAGDGIGYFVAWDDAPRAAVLVGDRRIAPAPDA
jgi:hypothetical protein